MFYVIDRLRFEQSTKKLGPFDTQEQAVNAATGGLYESGDIPDNFPPIREPETVWPGEGLRLSKDLGLRLVLGWGYPFRYIVER